MYITVSYMYMYSMSLLSSSSEILHSSSFTIDSHRYGMYWSGQKFLSDGKFTFLNANLGLMQ